MKTGNTGEVRLKNEIPGSELLATQTMSPSPLNADEIILREDRNFLGYLSMRMEMDSNTAPRTPHFVSRPDIFVCMKPSPW